MEAPRGNVVSFKTGESRVPSELESTIFLAYSKKEAKHIFEVSEQTNVHVTRAVINKQLDKVDKN